MHVAFILDFFNPNMGYASNFLPHELSQLGARVTLVVDANSLKPYIDGELNSVSIDRNQDIFRVKLSENLQIIGVPSRRTKIGVHLSHLSKVSKEECFTVMHSFAITTSILNWKLFQISKKQNIPLVLQDHTSKSVFHPNLRGRLYIRFFKAWVAPRYNRQISRCYFPSPDIADIVIEHYGISRELLYYEPLGVNSNWFHYPTSSEKINSKLLLSEYGLPTNKFIVLYAGRLTNAKGANLLAQVIGTLCKSNSKIIGLFVGNGSEKEIAYIKAQPGCYVLPMQHAKDLNKFYWAANLGVWPQEGSTSILDALASGLPAVVRSGLTEPERRPFEELVFNEGSVSDLARAISTQFANPALPELGRKASDLILQKHTWQKIAEKRYSYYLSIS